jgi:hypothetical protein
MGHGCGSLLVTAVLSVYLLWMFRHFKTRYAVHHPWEAAMQNRIGDYFKHPLQTNGRYSNKICRFGKDAIVALVLFLCARAALLHLGWLSKRLAYWLTWAALLITVACSLLNMNAVVYLLPYFAHEALWLSTALDGTTAPPPSPGPPVELSGPAPPTHPVL